MSRHSGLRLGVVVACAGTCLLVACSSGDPGPTAVVGSAVAATPAARANSPADRSTHIDMDRHVAPGTLAWKVVYTGHLDESHVHGSEADIAKGTTDVRWVVEGSARLQGVIESGALDKAGNDATGKIMAAAPSTDAIENAAANCGNDNACKMAAMMKLAHNKQAMSAMAARAKAQSTVLGRLDAWQPAIDPAQAVCDIKINGKLTSQWNGKARFERLNKSGVASVPFSAQESVAGTRDLACSSNYTPDVRMRADVVDHVYNLTLPGVQVQATRDIRFTTSGAQANAPATSHANLQLPAITLKGLVFAGTAQVLHASRTVHHAGHLASMSREVRLGNASNGTYAYAPAHDRPAIPLDATVTWTFTPDHE